MVYPLVGGYQLAVPPVPPPGEHLVLSLLGEEGVEEVGMASVSPTPTRSHMVIEPFPVMGSVRSSRPTQEEEEV